MKRLITILLVVVLVLPSLAFAQGGMGPGPGCKGYATTASHTCPSGTYMFYWDGDYDGSNVTACKAPAGVASTMTGSVVAGSPGISSGYGRSGNGMGNDAVDEGLTFDVASDDIVNDATGTIWFSVYIDTATINNNVQILEVSAKNAVSIFVVYISTTAKLTGRYPSAKYATLNSPTVSGRTWTRCKMTWDQPNDKFKVCIGATCSSEVTSLSPFTDTPTEFRIGERYGAVTMSFTTWVDDVYILSGYDAADPGYY